MSDDIESRRLDLETRRAEDDVRLRTEELDLRREELRQSTVKTRGGRWSSPVTLTLLGGVVTILSGLALATWQGQGNLKLERQKFESTLIVKAIETGDQNVAAKNLLFLLHLGLISDPNGKIAALQANPSQAPVLPSTNGTVPVPITAEDRANFFDLYEKAFGSLSPAQKMALQSVFFVIAEKDDLTDVRQVAYVLATIQSETARTFKPISEYGDEAYFEKRYAGRVGNIEPGDAARFKSRGYIPIDGRANYDRFNKALGLEGTSDDLVQHPERALDPKIAYRITAMAMSQGLAGGTKLDDYIFGDRTDYLNARKTVAGRVDNHAALIADNARKLEAILKASLDQPGPKSLVSTGY